MDNERFNYCIEKYKDLETSYNIGTYKEKTLHKVIKNYYCDDPQYQEVKFSGCVCDILKENDIIEVQTRNLNKLREKLDKYPIDYNVKIVYPIPHIKYINWIDPDTFEIKSQRKSPKVGTIYDAFKELYRIKMYLNKPNIKVTLLLIDVYEFRNLNGWSKDKKKGSVREDMIPTELIDEIDINDFRLFLPETLGSEFTSNDYKKAIKRNINIARTGLTILNYLGLIKVDHKDKRSNVYVRV